jgi:hypothetical protein
MVILEQFKWLNLNKKKWFVELKMVILKQFKSLNLKKIK